MRSKSSRVTAAQRKSAYRPWIESMEDRLLMAVITVTSTGDAINATDGVVTLREAITAADDNKNISDVVGVGAYGTDTIDFDIPGTGVHTIAPTSPLPVITDPVTIDGYTQPGSAPNTNPVGQGLNGTLLIEIDGENAGDVRFGMLEFQTTDSVVRGLVINRTQGEKIGIDSVGAAGDIQIEGNYIGTDATGTAGFAASPNPNSNARDGISIGSRGNTIGGTTPAARNLISGNIGSPQVSYGVNDISSIPLGIANFVEGNLIGTDVTGTKALGNGIGGVAGGSGLTGVGQLVVGGPEAGAGNLISGNGGIGVHIINGVVQGNLIGTDVTGTLPLGNATGVQTLGNVVVEHNTIAFNTVAGVQFTDINDVPTLGNLITQDSIFSNFGPGIGTSSYLNDSPDADGIQNYPTLASVMPSGAGTQVEGTLASKPSSNYRLEFFTNDERQEDVHDVSNFTMPGEFAEGRTYLGTINVTTDANGLASFTADLPALPAGQAYVTATATDITDDGSGPRNNTSPFSAVAVLGGPSFVVTNTNDSGLGSLREAIYSANLTPGTQTITFAIPANDPRHFYYRNDGIAGQVSLSDIAVTSAANDATIADIDPDWSSSWYSIAPNYDLPKIFDTVVIDGYSQRGSVRNTLPALGPLNTVLRIELDGTNAPGIGLNLGYFNESIDPGNSQIDGLAINRFGGDGIDLGTLNGGVTVAGNFIGTDVSGLLDLGNGGNGVLLNDETGDTIGGDDVGSSNLLSGNGGVGIFVVVSQGILIEGNVLGANRLLTTSLMNDGSAIYLNDVDEAPTTNVADASVSSPPSDVDKQIARLIRVTKNMIAWAPNATKYWLMLFHQKKAELKNTAAQVQNGLNILKVLGFPGKAEVQADAASGPTLLFDLGEPGVQPNDGDNPLTPAIDPDSDDGPNGLQNYPVLQSATSDATGATITGGLNSLTNTSFQLDFYSSSISPDIVRGGEQFLGSIDVTTDASGNAPFSFHSPIIVPDGQYVLSNASVLLRASDGTEVPGATSEFSDGVQVGAAPATAKLSVSQSATPNPVAAGSDLTFTVTVANAGPGTATGVHLVVTPPSGATFISATGGVTPLGGKLTFDLGMLGNGTSKSLSVVVQPLSPGTFLTSAVVSGNQVDTSISDITSSLAITAVDLTSPEITSVVPPSTKDKKQVIVLTFSEDLNSARAALLANYRLVTAGRDKKFGTKDDKIIALRSVTYNVATRSVTLMPRKKLSLGVNYRITVDGTSAHGVDDLAGNLLDNDRDGHESGNYVQIFRLVKAPPSKARRVL